MIKQNLTDKRNNLSLFTRKYVRDTRNEFIFIPNYSFGRRLYYKSNLNCYKILGRKNQIYIIISIETASDVAKNKKKQQNLEFYL